MHGEDAQSAIDRGGERGLACRDDGCLGLAAHRVCGRPFGIAGVHDEQLHLFVEGRERGIRVVDDLDRESRLAHEFGERRARLSELMPRVAVSPGSTHDDRLGHALLLVALLPAWHGSAIAAALSRSVTVTASSPRHPRGHPLRRSSSER